MRGSFLASAVLSTALFLPVAVSPPGAQADWLVMQDGSRIETDGPWRLDGRRVLFDLPNGTLSTVRASEVDLEASRVATDAAVEVASEAPDVDGGSSVRADRPEPVLVLTDKDIARAAPVVEGQPTPETVAATGASATVSAALDVESWEKTTTRDGFDVEIRGLLVNRGTGVRAQISLMVEVEDLAGNPHEAEAFLRSSVLESGVRTSFRAVFPGVDGVAGEPSFKIDSVQVAADADGIKVIDDETGAVRQTIRTDGDVQSDG